MTKNKMKAWYDDIDAATLQRIKTYSAFNDAKSKNLMVQTMYEYREKEIQDFKETNHELAEICIARKKRIAELEKEKCELLGIIQGKDKAIKELEEQISSLLSCKNCPENKGGYICKKEYENKCLAQKIQYIKELQEENAKQKKEIEISQRCWQDQKNISLDTNCKLHKAKELLRELYVIVKVGCSPFFKDEHKTILTEIKEFLKGE